MRDPNMKRERKFKPYLDFNDAGVLEVNMKGTWYRVTSTDFRAFSGPRRITERTVTKTGTETNEYKYEGPVFARDTNIEYVGPIQNRIIHRSEINEKTKKKTKRRKK